MPPRKMPRRAAAATTSGTTAKESESSSDSEEYMSPEESAASNASSDESSEASRDSDDSGDEAPEPVDLDDLEKLAEQIGLREPLYPGCRQTLLSSLTMLQDMFKKHRVSKKALSHMVAMMRLIFPKPCRLPPTKTIRAILKNVDLSKLQENQNAATTAPATT